MFSRSSLKPYAPKPYTAVASTCQSFDTCLMGEQGGAGRKQMHCRKLKRSYQSLEHTEHRNCRNVTPIATPSPSKMVKHHLMQKDATTGCFEQQRRALRPKRKFIIGNPQYTSESDVNENNDDDLDEADDESVAAAADDELRREGKSRGAGWRSLRAVVAYYCSLRKIKRNGAFHIIHLRVPVTVCVRVHICMYIAVSVILYTYSSTLHLLASLVLVIIE